MSRLPDERRNNGKQDTYIQGGESRGFYDRDHGILCQYLDKTCKEINYISNNIYSIIYAIKCIYLLIILGNHASI